MWLLSARKSKRKQVARSGRGTFRPGVEELEDRCLLSAGALDPTFGNGAGYVTTSINNNADYAHNALIQPNGDIVALGRASTSTGAELYAVRYNLDGSLDTSFGSGGIALASLGSGTAIGPYSALYPAGTANAGEIVQEGAYNSQYQILVRYNTNGTLDSSFGTGGEVMTAFPGMSGVASVGGGVVVTSSEQIVALSDNTSTNNQFALARYNVNGSLDATFGQGGYVIVSTGSANAGGVLLQQPNGDLIVSYGNNGVWDLYRFNANGTLDTSFGDQGLVTTAVNSDPQSAVLYPNAGTPNDGQIVLVGAPTNGKVPLARYNANGSLDTTFGTGGLMQTPISIVGVDAALDANGRIVISGSGSNNGVNSIAVARLNVNGTVDATFGAGGLVTTNIGGTAFGYAVAIYPNAGTGTDGDIVVVGDGGSTKTDAVVARYLGQATGPYFTVTGSTSVTAGTASTYTISVQNPDGSADTGYSGTVQITSSDPQAVLPANFTITGGTATFTATLKTAGSQSLTATDTVTSGISGSDAGITVTPAAATQFVLSGPTRVAPSAGFSITVTALDAYGNVATGYTGTVKFTDSATGATLPANYTFKSSDSGVHTFSRLKLKNKGLQTITVTDTLTGTMLGSWVIDVT